MPKAGRTGHGGSQIMRDRSHLRNESHAANCGGGLVEDLICVALEKPTIGTIAHENDRSTVSDSQ